MAGAGCGGLRFGGDDDGRRPGDGTDTADVLGEGGTADATTDGGGGMAGLGVVWTGAWTGAGSGGAGAWPRSSHAHAPAPAATRKPTPTSRAHGAVRRGGRTLSMATHISSRVGGSSSSAMGYRGGAELRLPARPERGAISTLPLE